MEIGNKIYWDNQLWIIKTMKQHVRVSDGCQYNVGIPFDDERSKVYKNGFILVRINK